MRKLVTCFALLVLLATLGCAWGRNQVQMAAATRVFDSMIKEGTAEQVVAPQQGMVSTTTFRTGRLDGGIAIICEAPNAAFWVKDDQTYVVNEAARSLLPKHPQAPSEITYDAADAAAQ